MLPTIVLGVSTGVFLYKTYDIERIVDKCSDKIKQPGELWQKIREKEKTYRREKQITLFQRPGEEEDD